MLKTIGAALQRQTLRQQPVVAPPRPAPQPSGVSSFTPASRSPAAAHCPPPAPPPPQLGSTPSAVEDAIREAREQLAEGLLAPTSEELADALQKAREQLAERQLAPTPEQVRAALERAREQLAEGQLGPTPEEVEAALQKAREQMAQGELGPTPEEVVEAIRRARIEQALRAALCDCCCCEHDDETDALREAGEAAAEAIQNLQEEAPLQPEVMERDIVWGDTLSGIAWELMEQGVPGPAEAIIQQICELNGIENPDLIYAGTTLLVPAPPGQGGEAEAPVEQAPVETPSGVDAPTGNGSAMAAQLEQLRLAPGAKSLAESGLAGQGALLLELSEKYDVPIDLALAMLWKESQWGSDGLSAEYNNPGNLKFVGQEGAYDAFTSSQASGSFAGWPTMAEGVEAYFKLLGTYYREFIDTGDWAGLVNKYAPPSENDSGLYLEQITQYAATVRETLGL